MRRLRRSVPRAARATGPSGRCVRRSPYGSPRSQPIKNILKSNLRLLPDDDLGADRDAVVKVFNVGIDQPEAAGRHGSADGLRLVGAVDAIHCGAEIKRTRAHWIAGPACHEARLFWLALDHLLRRRTVGPFLLAGVLLLVF